MPLKLSASLLIIITYFSCFSLSAEEIDFKNWLEGNQSLNWKGLAPTISNNLLLDMNFTDSHYVTDFTDEASRSKSNHQLFPHHNPAAEKGLSMGRCTLFMTDIHGSGMSFGDSEVMVWKLKRAQDKVFKAKISESAVDLTLERSGYKYYSYLSIRCRTDLTPIIKSENLLGVLTYIEFLLDGAVEFNLHSSQLEKPSQEEVLALFENKEFNNDIVVYNKLLRATEDYSYCLRYKSCDELQSENLQSAQEAILKYLFPQKESFELRFIVGIVNGLESIEGLDEIKRSSTREPILKLFRTSLSELNK